MFTCEMTHCDDMISHEVTVAVQDGADDVLEVCADCARELELDSRVLSVMKFAGIK